MSIQLHTMVNIKSIRKYENDGSFCAQIITSDAEGNNAFYACRLSGSNKLDTGEAYQFVFGKWEPITLKSELANFLEASFKRIISVTNNAYRRKHVADDGSVSYSMYADTVLYVSNETRGHAIKIDDKLFYTHSPRDLLPPDGVTKSIRYTLLGDPSVSEYLDMTKDTGTKIRLEKQFEIAREKYMRIVRNRPIGGGSWASVQNDRKEFGKSRYNHRELQRSRQGNR